MILNSFLLIGVEVVEACPVALLEEFKVVELLELEFVVDPPTCSLGFLNKYCPLLTSETIFSCRFLHRNFLFHSAIPIGILIFPAFYVSLETQLTS